MSSPFAAVTALSDALAAVATKAGESLVSISGRRWPATGICYGPDLVLTAAHATHREEALRVQQAASTVPAQLVGRDPALDVALLRVPGAAFSPASWVEPSQRRVGSLVLAVSRPR